MQSIFDIIRILIPLFLGGLFGYEVGLRIGFRKGTEGSFDPFYEEGYYNGWVARHHKLPLENRRQTPGEINKLAPSLMTPGQDISDWQRNGDLYPTISEYRQQIIDKLNKEIEK